MEKGRPGILVTVIASPWNAQGIEVLFSETTMIGISKRLVKRDCIIGNHRVIDLKGCKIRIKVALRNGRILKLAPEYNDCLLATETLKQSL